MRLNTCFVLLSLGFLALARAGPTPKIIEKKSLVENSKIEKDTDLKLEEAGSEKDRSKKSATTFCVQIRPGSTQATQTSCKDQHIAEQPQQSAQLNVQHQQQLPQQSVQLNVQPQQSAHLNVQHHQQQLPQQVQTLNVVQPQQQPSQTSIILPAQPMIQPVQTLHYVQPNPQYYGQSIPSVNILPAPQPVVQPAVEVHVQPAPESAPKPTIEVKPQPAPQPAPKPTPAAEVIMPAPEQPKPAQIVVQQLPEPQETISVLPVAPACNEQMYAISSSPMYFVPEMEQQQLATLVQVPTGSQMGDNHQHGLQCTCQSRNTGLMERAAFGKYESMMPMMAYPSSSFARSPMMVQVARNSDDELEMKPATQKERTSTSIHLHGLNSHRHHSHVSFSHYPVVPTYTTGVQPAYTTAVQPAYTSIVQPAYTSGVQPTYTSGVQPTYTAGAGLTINAYPHLYRSASQDRSTYKIMDGSLADQEYNHNSPIASEANDLMEPGKKMPREIDQKELGSDLKEGIQKDDLAGQATLVDGRRATRSSKGTSKVETSSSTKS